MAVCPRCHGVINTGGNVCQTEDCRYSTRPSVRFHTNELKRFIGAFKEAWDAFEFTWRHWYELQDCHEWVNSLPTEQDTVDLRQYDDGSYGAPHYR